MSHLTHRQFRTGPPGNLARLSGSTGYPVIPESTTQNVSIVRAWPQAGPTKLGQRRRNSERECIEISTSEDRSVNAQGILSALYAPKRVSTHDRCNVATKHSSARSVRSTIGRSLIFRGVSIRATPPTKQKRRGSESDFVSRYLFDKGETRIVF